MRIRSLAVAAKVLEAATCLVVVMSLGLHPAAAQDPGPTQPVGPNSNSFGFTVRPFVEEGSVPRDSLDYQLPAGHTLVDQVTVSNLTDKEKSFYLYPADAYSTSSGGFALRKQAEPAVDAGSWLTLPVTRYDIPARSAALIPVTLSIPPNAEPGDHAAGVIAEEIVAPTTAAENGGLQPIHRVATRVYIRVEGPTSAELHVSKITVNHRDPLIPYVGGNSATSVTYTIENRGNVRVALDSVKVKVSALFGYTVREITHDAESTETIPAQLLPGSEVVLTQRVGSIPALGPLTASVSVKGTDPVAEKDVHASASVRFWIIPWLLILVLAVLLTVGVLWRRRRREGDATSDRDPGSPLGADPSAAEADGAEPVTAVTGSSSPSTGPSGR
jgi:hypothetical protein